ncbi:MAG: phosphatidylglycerophosphatase A [Deltaproteobacteria bacterium]|nr:MAG: phosphatidylglycerophosphatase A [Deltaproteobacteria bacterium]
MNKKVALIFATGFGSGFAPFASGTWGSLVGLVFYVLFKDFSSSLYAVTLLGVFAISVWSAEIAEEHFGKKDPGEIVVDEIIGQLVSLAFLPFSWKMTIAGFLLFRLFDILKPFPARWFQDHLKGGWGVVMDDVMAGIYANLVLQILIRIFPNYLLSIGT